MSDLTKLHDDSPMPFGKHKGERMADVPASYLLWLWNEGVWENKHRPINGYIAENMSALKMDAPDTIVSHRP